METLKPKFKKQIKVRKTTARKVRRVAGESASRGRVISVRDQRNIVANPSVTRGKRRSPVKKKGRKSWEGNLDPPAVQPAQRQTVDLWGKGKIGPTWKHSDEKGRGGGAKLRQRTTNEPKLRKNITPRRENRFIGGLIRGYNAQKGERRKKNRV